MTQTSPSKELLSPREASLVLFGTDRKSQLNMLRRMLQRGIIKGKRLGGRWYITMREIERITDGGADLSDYPKK
jgi:hypothetical protein